MVCFERARSQRGVETIPRLVAAPVAATERSLALVTTNAVIGATVVTAIPPPADVHAIGNPAAAPEARLALPHSDHALGASAPSCYLRGGMMRAPGPLIPSGATYAHSLRNEQQTCALLSLVTAISASSNAPPAVGTCDSPVCGVHPLADILSKMRAGRPGTTVVELQSRLSAWSVSQEMGYDLTPGTLVNANECFSALLSLAHGVPHPDPASTVDGAAAGDTAPCSGSGPGMCWACRTFGLYAEVVVACPTCTVRCTSKDMTFGFGLKWTDLSTLIGELPRNASPAALAAPNQRVVEVLMRAQQERWAAVCGGPGGRCTTCNGDISYAALPPGPAFHVTTRRTPPVLIIRVEYSSLSTLRMRDDERTTPWALVIPRLDVSETLGETAGSTVYHATAVVVYKNAHYCTLRLEPDGSWSMVDDSTVQRLGALMTAVGMLHKAAWVPTMVCFERARSQRGVETIPRPMAVPVAAAEGTDAAAVDPDAAAADEGGTARDKPTALYSAVHAGGGPTRVAYVFSVGVAAAALASAAHVGQLSAAAADLDGWGDGRTPRDNIVRTSGGGGGGGGAEARHKSNLQLIVLCVQPWIPDLQAYMENLFGTERAFQARWDDSDANATDTRWRRVFLKFETTSARNAVYRSVHDSPADDDTGGDVDPIAKRFAALGRSPDDVVRDLTASQFQKQHAGMSRVLESWVACSPVLQALCMVLCARHPLLTASADSTPGGDTAADSCAQFATAMLSMMQTFLAHQNDVQSYASSSWRITDGILPVPESGTYDTIKKPITPELITTVAAATYGYLSVHQANAQREYHASRRSAGDADQTATSADPAPMDIVPEAAVPVAPPRAGVTALATAPADIRARTLVVTRVACSTDVPAFMVNVFGAILVDDHAAVSKSPLCIFHHDVRVFPIESYRTSTAYGSLRVQFASEEQARMVLFWLRSSDGILRLQSVYLSSLSVVSAESWLHAIAEDDADMNAQLQIACNDAVVNLYGRLAAHDVSSLSELRVASGPDALESQSRTALRLMVDVLIGNEGNFPCPAVDDADDDDADDELDAMTAPVHLRTLLARPEQRFVPGTPSAGSLARRALAAAGATSNAAPGAAAHDDSSRQIGGGEHPVVSPLPPPLLPPPPLDPSGGLHATDAAVATDSESSSLRTNPNPLAGAPRGATCGDRDVAKPDRALSTGFWLSSDNGYASAVTTPASSPMPPDPDTDAYSAAHFR